MCLRFVIRWSFGRVGRCLSQRVQRGALCCNTLRYAVQVFAIEDACGIMQRQLKKKGHSTAMQYNANRHKRDRCQTG